jgi:hypothetical protein
MKDILLSLLVVVVGTVIISVSLIYPSLSEIQFIGIVLVVLGGMKLAWECLP